MYIYIYTMLFCFFFIFLYCNIEILINKYYLPYIDLSSFNTRDIIIQNNTEFYYSIITTSSFIISLFGLYIFHYLFISNIPNIYSLCLVFVYIKYISNILISDSITLFEYEYSRSIMWAFTTPLMLKLYCDTNHLKLKDICFLYHYIPCVINIIIYPLKNNLIIYYIHTILSFISIFFFIKKLYSLSYKKFTNIFLFIWSVFITLHIIDIMKIINVYKLNTIYLLAYVFLKVTTTFIMYDNKEQQYIIKNNIDLQCINLISYIITKIKNYEINNVKQSTGCISLISYIKNKLNIFIPENKKELQIELLKKILPLGLEQKYIENTNENENFNENPCTNANKSFTNICVLFMDIVSYTELANKFDDNIIFKLLNDIYINFDIIIKRYSHLQKIETIGDAYMVVGDIFRDNNNYKIVVEEIILLALDFINEIKNIKTPDNKPLSIRIGINIGSVTVGILGIEIPRLCVVGNNVNIASRLQSTSQENTIQISEDMYEISKDIIYKKEIKYELKKKVFLKNIGTVNTYNIIPLLYSKI